MSTAILSQGGVEVREPVAAAGVGLALAGRSKVRAGAAAFTSGSPRPVMVAMM
jgi:hypothetical protein